MRETGIWDTIRNECEENEAEYIVGYWCLDEKSHAQMTPAPYSWLMV